MQKLVEVDSQQLWQILDNFQKQVRESSKLGSNITVSKFNNIVITGMGGSNLPGEITKSIVDAVPIILVKDYTLPKFVNQDTLVFAVSYSGNTEETLESFEEAIKRKSQVIAIASGGELEARAKACKIPFVQVQGGLPPRIACVLQAIPILNVLAGYGLINKISWESIANIKVPKEKAKALAERIANKIPLIYSSSKLYSAAYKWKKNFNENAKIHAFSNFFPEFNHNEINGYVHLNGNYIVIILRDKDDYPRIKKRIEIVSKLITSYGIKVIEINAEGHDFISRLIWLIRLSDWVSYYVALNSGTDPTPVKIIDDLKIALKR